MDLKGFGEPSFYLQKTFEGIGGYLRGLKPYISSPRIPGSQLGELRSQRGIIKILLYIYIMEINHSNISNRAIS